MDAFRNSRARWIAQHILPLEPSLRAWLRAQLRTSTLEVDDVIQETYAVFGELATTDHIRSPRHYAFQTARSIIVAHYRRSKIVPFEYLGQDDNMAFIDDSPSPEAEAAARSELGQVQTLLDEMPARQSEAFRLLKLQEKSQREAAEIMGIAESTLEKHISRAIHFLMDRLGRGGKADAHPSMDDVRQDRSA